MCKNPYEALGRVRNILLPIPEITRLAMYGDGLIGHIIRQLSNAVRGLPVEDAENDEWNGVMHELFGILNGPPAELPEGFVGTAIRSWLASQAAYLERRSGQNERKRKSRAGLRGRMHNGRCYNSLNGIALQVLALKALEAERQAPAPEAATENLPF